MDLDTIYKTTTSTTLGSDAVGEDISWRDNEYIIDSQKAISLWYFDSAHFCNHPICCLIPKRFKHILYINFENNIINALIIEMLDLYSRKIWYTTSVIPDVYLCCPLIHIIESES